MILPGDLVRLTNPPHVSSWDEDDQNLIFIVLGIIANDGLSFSYLLEINGNMPIFAHSTNRLKLI